MNVKDFAEEADITCEEAKEILEEKFDIIPLTDNFVLPAEVAEKIQKNFIGNKKYIKEILEHIRNENHMTVPARTKNSDIINELLDEKFSIFVDTNFIYNGSFINFISSIEDVLKARKAKLKVIVDVKEEIRKKAGNKKCRINNLAKSRLGILNRYIQNGIFKIEKEEDVKKICKENFADFTFQIIFHVYRRNNMNAMLITNDNDLTVDILMLNHVASVDSKAEMRVGRIDNDGLLIMQKLKPKK